MASFGTEIRKVNPLLGKAPPIFANDFDFLPITILAGGLNAPGFGGSAETVFFGAFGPPQSVDSCLPLRKISPQKLQDYKTISPMDDLRPRDPDKR